MRYEEFSGVNSFLVGMSKIMLTDSVLRNTRGYKCFELAAPIIIKIKNPTSRIVTLPDRQWNHILPYVESLWLATGRNDMSMVGHYVKKLYDFSDDSQSMRAGYGPRLRWFNGVSDDYQLGYHQHQSDSLENKTLIEVDQFRFVEQSFATDPFTRQGVISLADPAKDCFDKDNALKRTKDFPCTREIQFIRNDNKLDCIVHMRSNDLIWGASGVNIFNFTFMQEYFSQILGLEIGSYYHIVNNFHYYENFREKLEKLASAEAVPDDGYIYNKSFKNLNEFDEQINALENFEKNLRDGTTLELKDFNDEFFNDWAKVLFSFHHSQAKLKFSNPNLEVVAKRKLNARTIKQNKKQYDKTFSASSVGNENYWQNFI